MVTRAPGTDVFNLTRLQSWKDSNLQNVHCHTSCGNKFSHLIYTSHSR